MKKQYPRERITMRAILPGKVMPNHRGVKGRNHRGLQIAVKKGSMLKEKRNLMRSWRRIAGKEKLSRRDKAIAYLSVLIRRRK